MDEQKGNFSREVETLKHKMENLELKNVIPEIKIATNRLNVILEPAQERVIELNDSSIEIIQSETQRKKIKITEQSIRYM